MFFGFALCGYGAFRLGRTLTGSTAVGWVAGIVFAFVPYRFHLMSQVAYVFSPWIPLLFEALVCTPRTEQKARGPGLASRFFMSGLTTISWFTFSLVPFAIFAAILLTRYGLWRERDFWRRGAVALGTATLLLLPFFVPYVMVSRLYGFKRSIEEIKVNSACRSMAVSRDRNGCGAPWEITFQKVYNSNSPRSASDTFLLRRCRYLGVATTRGVDLLGDTAASITRERWLRRLNTLIIISFAISILRSVSTALMHSGTLPSPHSRGCAAVMDGSCTGSAVSRVSSVPDQLQRDLVETLRSKRRCDAFWLGMLLTLTALFFVRLELFSFIVFVMT